MPIWRQPNGKVYRNPATCNVVNCPTSPCDVTWWECSLGVCSEVTGPIGDRPEDAYDTQAECEAACEEEGVETSCCPNPIPETLTIAWTGSDSSGGSGPGGSDSLVYDGSLYWFGTITVGTPGTDADIRVFCDGTDWKMRSYAPGSPTVNQERTMTEDSCSPLLLSTTNNFSTNGGWDIDGTTISE